MAKKPITDEGRARLKAMSERVKNKKAERMTNFDSTGYERVTQYQFFKLIGGHRADVYPSSGTVSFRNKTVKNVDIPKYIESLEADFAAGKFDAR